MSERMSEDTPACECSFCTPDEAAAAVWAHIGEQFRRVAPRVQEAIRDNDDLIRRLSS